MDKEYSVFVILLIHNESFNFYLKQSIMNLLTDNAMQGIVESMMNDVVNFRDVRDLPIVPDRPVHSIRLCILNQIREIRNGRGENFEQFADVTPNDPTACEPLLYQYVFRVLLYTIENLRTVYDFRRHPNIGLQFIVLMYENDDEIASFDSYNSLEELDEALEFNKKR